jgi:hypothetical protein
MKGWQKRMTISLLFAASVSPSIEPQEAFKAKELFEKDFQQKTGARWNPRAFSSTTSATRANH